MRISQIVIAFSEHLVTEVSGIKKLTNGSAGISGDRVVGISNEFL